MGDGRSGVSKAIADAGPLGVPSEPETIDLFDGDAAAGSPIEGTARALGLAGQIAPHRRGPGRPKGSRNIATADVLRFINARYRHPLLALADVASMNWRDLAELLVPEPQSGPDDEGDGDSGDPRRELDDLKASKISKEDMWRAAQLQLQAARELAEYMVPKQPRQVTLTPDSAPLLQVFLDQHQGEGGGSMVNVTQFGFQENPMKTTDAKGVGDEVLESEVLQQPNNPENSNG